MQSIVSYKLYMREYNSGNDFSVIYTGSNLEYDKEANSTITMHKYID